LRRNPKFLVCPGPFIAKGHNDENHAHLKYVGRGAVLLAGAYTTGAGPADALPSWNDSATKKSIVEFVTKVTKKESPDFVPPARALTKRRNAAGRWWNMKKDWKTIFPAEKK
jgi:hypothetical protein